MPSYYAVMVQKLKGKNRRPRTFWWKDYGEYVAVKADAAKLTRTFARQIAKYVRGNVVKLD